MNAQNTIMKAIPSVIARFIPATGKPSVFLADEIPGNTARMFTDGVLKEVPIEFYKDTLPLNESDTHIAVEEYKKFAGVEMVNIRQRMPYTKLKSLASRLSVTPEAMHKIVEEVPKEQKEVLNHMAEKEALITPRQRAARERYARENAVSVMKHIKELPENASQADKEKAVEDLGKAMARVIAGLL